MQQSHQSSILNEIYECYINISILAFSIERGDFQMKSPVIRQKFVELRAQGWSFRRISKELGVAFNTLLNWNKELQEEILHLEKVEREALLEKHSLLIEQRIAAFGSLLNKALGEIESRDFANLPLRDLVLLMEKAQNVLNTIEAPKNFSTLEELPKKKQNREVLEAILF